MEFKCLTGFHIIATSASVQSEAPWEIQNSLVSSHAKLMLTAKITYRASKEDDQRQTLMNGPKGLSKRTVVSILQETYCTRTSVMSRPKRT